MARLVASLGLALVATLASLGAAELGARALAPQWAPQHAERGFWRYDPLLGWAHRPGRGGVLRHPDFSVEVEISSQGFRDRVYPTERVPGLRRMLVLGDSFAWGFGVERAEILWERIEARHPDWEIINTAVSGYGTDQELLFFELRGEDFEPDVVALLFHPNDVEDNAADRRYGYPKPRFTLEAEGLVLGNVPVPQLSAPWRARRWLRERSYLFNRLQVLGRGLEARGVSGLRAAGVGPWGDAATPGLSVTAGLLERLQLACRAAGAQLVVVSAPAPEPLRLELGRILSDLRVPYRPLDAAFRGRPRESYKFPHDPHWNAAGQRIAADAVEEFLFEIDVFP